MTDAAFDFEFSLRNMNKQEWVCEVTELVAKHGYLKSLGTGHTATFIQGSSTLLVTFETHQSIQTLSPDVHPLGWEMVKSHDWSNLAIISDGDTWFRDQMVYDYFDHLVDEGFFDTFETILFYGAGSCGYAAAAFSVAAPGARVLVVQPQATLDPRITGWDTRFLKMRRTDFNHRYGYAPDMLDAAMQAFVVYDPSETADAMHAALFTRPAISKLRMPFMGDKIQTRLSQMEILVPLLKEAASGVLTDESFAKLARARRDHMPYLRNLLTHLNQQNRDNLIITLCRNVVGRKRAPRFRKRLLRLTRGAED